MNNYLPEYEPAYTIIVLTTDSLFEPNNLITKALSYLTFST
jgi:hypothetical protein